MADQKLITVYAGDATPQNIILRALPIRDPLPTTTIYVRAGDATPQNIILRNPAEAPSAPSFYSITVTSSAVTAIGTGVNLKRALRISVSTAAITAAGSSVNLRRSLRIAITSAAVTATGSSVNLKVGRQIAITSAPVTLTGSSVALRVARKIATTSATVALAGSSVDLTYSPAQQSHGTSSGSYNQWGKGRRPDDDVIEVKVIGKAKKQAPAPRVPPKIEIPKIRRSNTAASVIAKMEAAEWSRLSAQRRAMLMADDDWLMMN